MKYIITERQLRLIKEDQDKILKVDMEVFNNRWDILQKFLERRGNPPYIITGDLDFREDEEIPHATQHVETLGNLIEVEGNLNLFVSRTIKDLGNLRRVGGWMVLEYTKIETLGNLESVGGNLILFDCRNLKSLGNLKYVGGALKLGNTPFQENKTEKEIRSQVEVGGRVMF